MSDPIAEIVKALTRLGAEFRASGRGGIWSVQAPMVLDFSVVELGIDDYEDQMDEDQPGIQLRTPRKDARIRGKWYYPDWPDAKANILPGSRRIGGRWTYSWSVTCASASRSRNRMTGVADGPTEALRTAADLMGMCVADAWPKRNSPDRVLGPAR